MRTLKAFADLPRITSWAEIHEKMATPSAVGPGLVRQNGTLAGAIHDRSDAVRSLQRLSIPFAPVFPSAKRRFGMRRAFVMLLEATSASEDIWQR
jgi:predicted component of type VI protein secretion system